MDRGTSAFENWKKGGLRYRQLKKRVPEFFGPIDVDGFFVAVRESGAGAKELVNPLSVFRREYVIAIMSERLAIVKISRPVTFNAKILGVEYEADLTGADIEWTGSILTVNGGEYAPVAFHREDAERIAKLLAGRRPADQ